MDYPGLVPAPAMNVEVGCRALPHESFSSKEPRKTIKSIMKTSFGFLSVFRAVSGSNLHKIGAALRNYSN